jgi:sortase A
LQYNRVFFAQVEAYVSPGSVVNENDTVLVDPSANANVGPEPKLIIPKINVNIKVIYDITSLQDAPVQEGLNHGVVHYKLPGANSLPGQAGNMAILGHSSNDIFDPGDYKFAFVLLDRLQPGDIAYMHYQGKRYIYRVTDKKVINPTEFSVLQQNNGKPTLVLVTCTPPGTALKRLLVFAEQISPDPATATQPNGGQASSSEPTTLPANSPTLFERIRDFFF